MTRVETAAAQPSGGVFYILLAATGFGLLPVLTRAADALGIPVETMLVARFVGPAVIFLPWLARSAEAAKSAALLFFAGMFIGAGAFGYLNALVELEVATAALIFFTFPLFTIVFGLIFGGARPSVREMSAVAVILAATLIILRPQAYGAGSTSAVLLAFATPAAYGFLILALSQTASQLGVRARSAPTALGALVGSLPLFLHSGAGSTIVFNIDVAMVLAAQLTVAGLIPQIALVVGTRRTGATLAAIAATAELVIALLSGWTVLGEPVRTVQVIGAAMVIGAIIVAATAKR